MKNNFKVKDFMIIDYKGISIFCRSTRKAGGTWWFEFLCCLKGEVVKNSVGAEFIVPKGVVIARNMAERIGYEIVMLTTGGEFDVIPTRVPKEFSIRVATPDEVEKYKPLAMLNQL